MFRFTLTAGARGPRTGTIETSHGVVQTPAFMPVGTQATVKSLAPADVRATGAEILLCNAYHLMLRPGTDLIARAGGLHGFMRWDRPILTDSGGFQVFSLGHLRSVTDQGAVFRSHLDGGTHELTPERAMAVEEALGADIIMAFDECPPAHADYSAAATATERTNRWAERCVTAHTTDQALFAICQGGMHADLRRASAELIAGLDVAGCAIGGLSVGEEKALTWPMLEASVAPLPVDKPRYMMGVGSPEDLIEGVRRGVDMFDCVLPTRLGRNGALFTRDGRINISNARYAADLGPVDPECDCPACADFSAAYLRHLFAAEELLAYRLASQHNIRFLVRLMEQSRAAITAGAFDTFAETFLARYRPANERTRIEQRAKWERRRNPHPPTPSPAAAGEGGTLVRQRARLVDRSQARL
ncbi:MAG: tRNA guanosine(34) transglycosylase Tgt [Chloroflexi bacterium]|nr:tRNA guanosine(34) transglycosylase Tgt [Chloroflexota bacterium]